MTRGPYSMLLMLAMSLPGAARALGLGDIRIDSALNEPLSAQIDIVGATRDELLALTATVANQEIFQRYGADRPAFLSSATFKVGIDANGRPVLNVRSREAFTDPLVSFLVDLRWGKNDVVREYSLLLDPPGLAAPRPAAALAAAPAEPERGSAPRLEVTAQAQAPHDQSHAVPAGAARPQSQHRVAAGDTLRGVARRAGARNESAVQRTMIAIFNANPAAFDGNINRLHEGALLSIPSAADVEAVPSADAKRVVRAHMTAWRLDGRPATARRLASVTAGAAAISAAMAPVHPTASAAPAPHAVLNDRVQTLEKALDDLHQQLARESANIQDLKDAAARSEVAPVTTVAATPTAVATTTAAAAATTPGMSRSLGATPRPAPVDTAPDTATPLLASVGPQTLSAKLLLAPVAVTFGLLFAGVAYARKRFQRASTGDVTEAVATADVTAAGGTATGAASAGAATAGPAMAGTVPPRAGADLTASDTERSAPAAATVAAEPKPGREPAAWASAAELPGDDAAPASSAFAASLKDALTAPAAAGAPAATVRKNSLASELEETGALEIDTEMLERSYLESLTADATLETVVVDTSEMDTGLLEADLNTLVMAPGDFADARALEDTNKLASVPKIDTAAINKTELDYNLLDLDATALHVHMPSGLHDRSVTKERRTNVADVLKTAIEREPHRSDLRMKLLETYYSAASMNQRAFVDAVRKLSRESDQLSAEDWRKVMLMGRDIASHDILFADGAKDGDVLADCA